MQGVARRVCKAVLQLQVVRQAASAPAVVRAADGISGIVGHQVVGLLLVFQFLHVGETERIMQSKLALAMVQLGKRLAVGALRSERLHKFRADGVAPFCPVCNDVYYKGDALAVAHTRVLDEVNRPDGLRVERGKVAPVGYNVVDTHLELPHVWGHGDALGHLVHRDIWQCEARKQAVGVGGGILLLLRGQQAECVVAVHYAFALHYNFLQRHRVVCRLAVIAIVSLGLRHYG